MILLFIAKRIEFIHRMKQETTKYNCTLMMARITQPTPIRCSVTLILHLPYVFCLEIKKSETNCNNLDVTQAHQFTDEYLTNL